MKIRQVTRGFRDPIWQGISVIITIIGLMLSAFITYDIYWRSSQFSELQVQEYETYSMGNVLEETRGDVYVNVVVNGVVVDSVVVTHFSITNTGTKPIVPNDYLAPILVSVDEPWQILTVESADARPSDIPVQWSKVSSKTFEMEPALLNPGDQLNIRVFTNDLSQLSDGESLPDISWKARIINISALKIVQSQPPEDASGLGSFYVSANFSGWGLYLFLAIATGVFIISSVIGIYFDRINHISISSILLLSITMILSLSSANTIGFLVGNPSYYKRWSGSSPLLGIHILLLFYFAWPAIRGQIGPRSTRPSPPA